MKQNRSHSSYCSCNDCLYNQDPSHPIKVYGKHDNKIEKFYHGKYLPLREKILIEKLVKTRAIYDHVRKQLLEKTENKQEYPDLFQRKNDKNDIKNINKIHKIVESIDKGNIGRRTKLALDECCSCCLCKSKRNLYKKHDQKPGIHYQRLTRKSGNTLKAVTFKISKILAESCKCSLKISKQLLLIPVRSILKKSSPTEEQKENEEIIISPKKIKADLCLCSKLSQLRDETIEKIKDSNEKLKSNVKESLTYLQNKFDIKKDSLTLFREKLKKRQNAHSKHQLKLEGCDLENCSNIISLTTNARKTLPSAFNLKRCFCTLQLTNTEKHAKKKKINKKKNALCECKFEDANSTLGDSRNKYEQFSSQTPCNPFSCNRRVQLHHVNQQYCLSPLECLVKTKGAEKAIVLTKSGKIIDILPKSLSKYNSNNLCDKCCNTPKHPKESSGLPYDHNKTPSTANLKVTNDISAVDNHSENVSQRRVVRISSSFSFKIEISKENAKSKAKYIQTNQDILKKAAQNIKQNASLLLKRCFCNLPFHKPLDYNDKQVDSTSLTEATNVNRFTSMPKNKTVKNKRTPSRNKNMKHSKIQCMCEDKKYSISSFVDTLPTEDPSYLNPKTKVSCPSNCNKICWCSQGTNTDDFSRKSVVIDTSNLHSLLSNKSPIIPKTTGKSYDSNESREWRNLRAQPNKFDLHRKSTTIGSNFSFNIEFYKEKLQPKS